ncbi:MAG: TolC family protein [Capsulimonadaceae bacterium]
MTTILKRSALCLLLAAGLAGTAQAQVVPPSPTTVPNPLSLSQAINIALAHQPSQWIAKTQERSASGTLEQTMSQYYPNVVPTYTYESDSSMLYSSGGLFSTKTSGGTGTVTATETIIDTGKRELVNAQSRQGRSMAKYSAANTNQTVIDAVTEDYYNLLRAIDLVKVDQSLVDEAQTVVNQVQAEVNAGTVAAASIYQAQATLANAQVTLTNDQAAIVTASATIKNELGVDNATVVNPVPLVAGDQLPPVPAASTQPTLQDDIDTAYANRPDLKAQEFQVEYDEIAVKVANVEAGLQGTATAEYLDTAHNDFGPTSDDRRFMLTATFPLFDGGLTRGEQRVAEAQRDSARDTLEEDRLAVHEDVEQEYGVYSAAYNAANLAQTAYKAAQVNYDSAVAEQKEGLETVVDVVTAQATLAQAKDSYVNAIYNFYVDNSALSRALGLDNTAPAPSAPATPPPLAPTGASPPPAAPAAAATGAGAAP